MLRVSNVNLLCLQCHTAKKRSSSPARCATARFTAPTSTRRFSSEELHEIYHHIAGKTVSRWGRHNIASRGRRDNNDEVSSDGSRAWFFASGGRGRRGPRSFFSVVPGTDGHGRNERDGFRKLQYSAVHRGGLPHYGYQRQHRHLRYLHKSRLGHSALRLHTGYALAKS